MKKFFIFFTAFAAFTAILPAVATRTAALTVPPPVHADTESDAGAALRATAPRTLSDFTLSADCHNLSTNAFELRFATATNVTAAATDLVIGFDGGRWFARGPAAASFVQTTNAVPAGSFALEIAVHFDDRDALRPVSVLAGGNHVPCLEAALSAARPKSWRGVLAVSRRTDGGQPSVVTLSTNRGLEVRVR